MYVPSLVQIAFLNSAKQKKYVVKAFTREEHEKIKGRIQDFDNYSVIFRDTSEEQKPFMLIKNQIGVMVVSDKVELPDKTYPVQNRVEGAVAQDHFLEHAIAQDIPVSIELANGETYSGKVKNYDNIVCVLHIETQYYMIYKCSVKKVFFPTGEHNFQNRK
ncbi:RNA chaperone Hfq [Pontibacillus yanchengensis]|nr:RNA chaperone Hfq [Pontibacillus yanchengensis]